MYVKDLVQTSQAQLQQGQQLFSAGSIARKDLVQLEAQQATDAYSLVVAQNTYRQISAKALKLKPDSALLKDYVIIGRGDTSHGKRNPAFTAANARIL